MRMQSRRQFLDAGLGFGSLALATLLHHETALKAAPAVAGPLTPKLPHFAPKAKSVIWLFMTGSPSQVDTFDYKPELQKRDGQALAGADPKTGFFTTSGKCLKSPFAWAQHGQSGAWVSDLFPHISNHVDDMAFVHSCYSTANNHAPAAFLISGGLAKPGFPCLGAWVTYGLGTVNQNLPAYVVMHGPKPRGDDGIWAPGFLPKSYQALAVGTSAREPIPHLSRAQSLSDEQQRGQLDLIRLMNQEHQSTRPLEGDLSARIDSFELAYRMQMAAPEAFDVSRETVETRRLYGVDQKETQMFGRQCLTARRLVERGVRFVQLFCDSPGGTQEPADVPWDCHKDLKANHTANARATDQPIAALLADLKAKGLLDSTLVIWSGEFGRTSDSQGAAGRDHNPHAFTIWMAGGGVKGGVHHGTTDEFGYKAIDNRVHPNDLHATILHLLGLDHEKLTYRHNGRDYRLTDVAGKLIEPILA